MPQPTQHHNLAARMARWSGRHRKVAILGWLGLMVTLFAFSLVSPMNMIVYETSGPGESGRANEILYEDFEQPAGESVLVQSTRVRRPGPAVPGGRRRCRRDGRLARRGRVRRVAVRRGGDRTDLGGPGLRPGAAGVRRCPRGRQGQDRRGRLGGRRGPGGTSRLLRRLVRREHQQGAERLGPGRPEDRRHVLGAADADHPADRVRGGRRGRDPVAARAERGARDAGPGLDREQRGSDGRHRVRSCAADRVGRRRGLLDVLPQAGA